MELFPTPKQGMKIPPQSIEAEMAVLGAILLDNRTIPEVMQLVKASDFYKESHQQLFQYIVDIYERGDPVDLVSLSNALKEKGKMDKVGGTDYVRALADTVATSANVAYYARTIRNASKMRRAIFFMVDKMTEAYSHPLEEADSFLDDLSSGSVLLMEEERTNPVEHVSKPTSRLIDRYMKMQDQPGGLTGISTGLLDLDSALAGWQEGDLIIIAGRPSMGKTAFALKAIKEATKGGIPSLIFSLEMSKESLVQRMLSDLTGEAHSKLRAASRNVNWSGVFTAADLMAKRPLFIDDTAAISVTEVKSKSRMMCVKENIGLVVIDYLQLMIQGVAKRHEELGMITKALKGLAKERKIPVILLSQLNRNLESRDDKRPILSDLRESGEIEEDSDVVIFVYRDEKYCSDCKKGKSCDKDHQGKAEIIIGKQRNGPTWTVDAMFDDRTVSFRDIEKKHVEERKPYRDGGEI